MFYYYVLIIHFGQYSLKYQSLNLFWTAIEAGGVEVRSKVSSKSSKLLVSLSKASFGMMGG